MFVLLLQLLLLPPALGYHPYGAHCIPDSLPSQNGDRCYVILMGNLTFDEAVKQCKEVKEGDLASVHNSKDNNEISELVDGPYWVGGSRRGSAKRWTWEDKSLFDYNRWAAGQPRKASGDKCVMVDHMTGLWSSKDCSRKAFFVCQLPPRQHVTTRKPSDNSCPTGAICRNGFAYLSPDAEFYSWQAAENYCIHKHNGHLASIHDNATQNALQKVYGHDLTIISYIGGYVDSSNKLSWIDGTPFDYAEWLYGNKPDPQPGMCLAIYFLNLPPFGSNRGWEMVPCEMEDNSYAAICQFRI
ncbi:hypothetical protein L596_016891 [Steinernema carpocapsae]|uniref:C-type lectin domain-containing protein n=1 Tax=Steinernema carpocapsae TaxID=34508 RepID=A0A4U5NKP4_STECR|nr:hypothetical protein L596_016891 [Steinernema carpocapsae]